MVEVRETTLLETLSGVVEEGTLSITPNYPLTTSVDKYDGLSAKLLPISGKKAPQFIGGDELPSFSKNNA